MFKILYSSELLIDEYVTKGKTKIVLLFTETRKSCTLDRCASRQTEAPSYSGYRQYHPSRDPKALSTIFTEKASFRTLSSLDDSVPFQRCHPLPASTDGAAVLLSKNAGTPDSRALAELYSGCGPDTLHSYLPPQTNNNHLPCL